MIKVKRGNRFLVENENFYNKNKEFSFRTISEIKNINHYRMKDCHILKFLTKKRAENFIKKHNLYSEDIVFEK